MKNIDHLKFGAHQLDGISALYLDGDFDSVINLLQGQVTSDCSKLEDGHGQPSALCDEKGYVLCNFDIFREINCIIEQVVQTSLYKIFSSTKKNFIFLIN